MILIGLSGKQRHGKDTVADYLCERFRFQKVAWGDALKRCLIALDPIIDIDLFDSEIYGPSATPIRLSDALKEKSLEQLKHEPEVRALLQRMGTEAGRNILGPDIWVDAGMRYINSLPDVDAVTDQGRMIPLKKVVVSDVRFPNEAERVRAEGGVLWRIERPGEIGMHADHSSETALDNWPHFDLKILNDGTIEDLHKKVEAIVMHHIFKEPV